MNVKKGEVYVCREPYCGVEIEVIRGANPTCHGRFNLCCCCGKEMVLQGAEAEEKHPEEAAVAS